ncbi:MAG: copper amine oxidase N-terminal domain-containing protein [Clostridia bacterium]|nr:copper amine oxidase N-terminal domain-containing protein [Clostridia bacterium]
MKRKIYIAFSLVLLLSLLLPSWVFAATNRHASTVIVSNIDAEADGKEKVLVTIYLRDGTNNPSKDTVFIGTDRGSIDKFWVKKDKKWIAVSSLSKEAGDNIYYISNNIIRAEINDRLELGISSNVKGNAKIGVSLKGERELRQYLSGHLSEAQAEIIPVKYSGEPKTVTETKYYKIALQNTEETDKEYFTFTDNKVYISVLDKGNKVIKVDENIKAIDLSYEIINKPEKAKVTLNISPEWEEELRETGITYFVVNSNLPGQIEFDVSLKIKYKNSFNPDQTLNTNVKINILPKKFGAAEITLFLNQENVIVDKRTQKLQLPPFIEEGRTFVPVRFLGEALGAEVKWNPDTQTIVITRPDKMITMTIGNNVLLLNDGQIVMSDVPPFIKNGFTVLPFRAIAEAFGAKVSVGYNDKGEMDRVLFYNG